MCIYHLYMGFIPLSYISEILWMVAKSCLTKRMVEICLNPRDNGSNHISTGAGFRNHPPYPLVTFARYRELCPMKSKG